MAGHEASILRGFAQYKARDEASERGQDYSEVLSGQLAYFDQPFGGREIGETMIQSTHDRVAELHSLASMLIRRLRSRMGRAIVLRRISFRRRRWSIRGRLTASQSCCGMMLRSERRGLEG